MTRIEYATRDDLVYFINEDKGVVVAKYFPKQIFGKLLKPFQEIFDSVEISEAFDKQYSLKDYYVGKAVCSSEDTFDIEVGKKIARFRAYTSCNKDIHKVMDKYLGVLYNAAEFISTEKTVIAKRISVLIDKVKETI